MPKMSKNKRRTESNRSLSFIGLEILGNTSGVSPCGLSLNTSGRSYLFNCGDGLQKIMSEYKIKPSKYQDIFITYPSWKNIGGLIGVSLGLQESHVKFCSIHGHGCLEELFSALKYVVNFKGLQQFVRQWDHNSKFSDEYITVEFVHLHHSASLNLNKSEPASAVDQFDKAGSLDIKNKNDMINKEHLSNLSTTEHENKNSNNVEQTCSNERPFKKSPKYALSFIIHTEKSLGSLSFEKCMDLGVPVGPMLGKLKKGEDIDLGNGQIIKSSDVKLPDLPGVIIIVVECPTEDFVEALLHEPAFFKHQSNRESYFTCAVVHFSNSNIIKSKKYQEWMSRFSDDTKHVFVNESTEIGAFIGAYRHQFKLNMVHSEIFPKLHPFGIPDFPRAKNCEPNEGHIVVDTPEYLNDKNSPLQIHSDKVFYRCENNYHIFGETLCEICLKPKRNFDYSKCLTLKKDEYMREMLEISDFESKLAEFKEKIECLERTTHVEKKIYPKIVFLGTGSKKPSKTRNSAGILVFLSEDKPILLDCGESIYCQLLFFFGEEKTKEVLRNLSAVFISHLHVDHHFGLSSLIIKRKSAMDELNKLKLESDPLASGGTDSTPFKPLRVIAPVQLLPLLHYFSREIYDVPDLYTIIPSKQFLNPSPGQNVRQFISDLNLESLQTTTVKHAPNSFGISLKHKDGWKLTYSGDTKPCQNLVNIGKDSDILIHEATFDDIYEVEAEQKHHTTTSQAILIGRKMNAKFILLTHFSQRYCHLPVIKDELLSKQDVGIAFDFMQVSPYQFPILPLLYEPLKLVFTTYREKQEHRETLVKMRKFREKFIDRALSDEDYEQPTKIPKLKKLG